MRLDPYFCGRWKVVSTELEPILGVGDVVNVTYEDWKGHVEVETRDDVEVKVSLAHEDGITGGFKQGETRRSFSFTRHRPYSYRTPATKEMIKCSESEMRGPVVMCPGRWLGERVEEEG